MVSKLTVKMLSLFCRLCFLAIVFPLVEANVRTDSLLICFKTFAVSQGLVNSLESLQSLQFLIVPSIVYGHNSLD